MAAVYPGTIPTAVDVAGGATLATNPHSTLHDNMYDEVVAIATEMGINASGASATVDARIGLVETGLTWTSWTSGTVTAGVEISKTITYSKYVRLGRLVIWSFKYVYTSSGTANNLVVVSLPFAASTRYGICGRGYVFVNTTAIFEVEPRGYTTQSISFLHVNTQGQGEGFGVTSTQVSGGSCAGVVLYEAAS